MPETSDAPARRLKQYRGPDASAILSHGGAELLRVHIQEDTAFLGLKPDRNGKPAGFVPGDFLPRWQTSEGAGGRCRVCAKLAGAMQPIHAIEVRSSGQFQGVCAKLAGAMQPIHATAPKDSRDGSAMATPSTSQPLVHSDCPPL
jgi:hypothetical protein